MLVQTVAKFERDEVVQAALGPNYTEFISLEKAESANYHAQVSRWEVERYRTMFYNTTNSNGA